MKEALMQADAILVVLRPKGQKKRDNIHPQAIPALRYRLLGLDSIRLGKVL
jgi:hypothetical protein